MGKKKGGRKAGKATPSPPPPPPPPPADTLPCESSNHVITSSTSQTRDQQFRGSRRFHVRCPTHKYDSTLAFYRDILALSVCHTSKASCEFEWGNNSTLCIHSVPCLTHVQMWLELLVDDVSAARAYFESKKRVSFRKEVDSIAGLTPDEFCISAQNDLIHIISSGAKEAKGKSKPTAVPPGKCPADSDDGGNPLIVDAASHAPGGQNGKVGECKFAGGCNIAIKCTHTKYPSTVAFYREVLQLPILHYCQNCCKIEWAPGLYLWVDCMDSPMQTVTWLEIKTASTATAREYLKAKKRVAFRSEVATLPEGIDGFWVAPPNDMVHLIRGPDGLDDTPMAPGDLAATPFQDESEDEN